MALVKCPECGKDISSNADACPHCGNPMRKSGGGPKTAGTYCPACKKHVAPVVTSVGGGSCSVGSRETWKCPTCTRVLHRSGCFVATATYGDEDMVEVRFLRAFRDEILARSAVGRTITRLYYRASPYIARAVERMPILRPPCRGTLDAIVATIERRTHLKRHSFRDPLP